MCYTHRPFVPARSRIIPSHMLTKQASNRIPIAQIMPSPRDLNLCVAFVWDKSAFYLRHDTWAHSCQERKSHSEAAAYTSLVALLCRRQTKHRALCCIERVSQSPPCVAAPQTPPPLAKLVCHFKLSLLPTTGTGQPSNHGFPPFTILSNLARLGGQARMRRQAHPAPLMWISSHIILSIIQVFI